MSPAPEHPSMSTRQSALGRGTDRGRAIVRQLSLEAEAARRERGTSYAEIGRALQLSPSQVAQICRGRSPEISVLRMAQLMAVLGLDLSARAYPSGHRLRDAAQIRLLQRLRARVGAALRWRFEVPVIELPAVGAVDHRAWDAAIDGPDCRVKIDAETHVGDFQAVLRRTLLKQRDGREPCVILLLADTRHHRTLLELIGEELAASFPISPRRAIRLLAQGRAPEENALILL